MKLKPKPLYETGWVEHHRLYESLFDCLDFIEFSEKHCWDPTTTTETSDLYNQLLSSKFLVSFTVCQYIFGFTKCLARQLQKHTWISSEHMTWLLMLQKKKEKNWENVIAEFLQLFANVLCYG